MVTRFQNSRELQVLAHRIPKVLRVVTISRIPYSEGSLPRKHNFLKFKHENVIKMKNKPVPSLLGPSNLSNEIKERVTKSRETIPVKNVSHPFAVTIKCSLCSEKILPTVKHKILQGCLNCH
jgi:hypothetical protein